jgi:hypothetical protein
MTFVFSGVASAQSTYGTITGVVRDPSGAVISQAKVEATNQNTSVVRTVTTNSEGFYELVSLDPGTYTIAAVAEGFSRAEKKGSASVSARIGPCGFAATAGRRSPDSGGSQRPRCKRAAYTFGLEIRRRDQFFSSKFSSYKQP